MDEEFNKANFYDVELSDQEILENKVSDFLSNHIEDILDIFFNFENAFYHTPEFLEHAKNTCEKLLNFLIQTIFYNSHHERISTNTYNKLLNFTNEYYQEINSSYNIIYNFSKKFDNPIMANDWILFCYNESFKP